MDFKNTIYLLIHLGGLAFLSHCCYDIKLLQLHNLPPFYCSVPKYWQDYRSDFSNDSAQIHNEIIWNNSKIVIDRKTKTIFFKHWFQNEILRLQDLLDADSTFLSIDKFQQKTFDTCSLHRILWTDIFYLHQLEA